LKHFLLAVVAEAVVRMAQTTEAVGAVEAEFYKELLLWSQELLIL
jgi:hypothetical protein